MAGLGHSLWKGNRVILGFPKRMGMTDSQRDRVSMYDRGTGAQAIDQDTKAPGWTDTVGSGPGECMDLAFPTRRGESGTSAGAVPVPISAVFFCPRHSLVPLFQLVLQIVVLTATCEPICALPRAEASATTPLHTGVWVPAWPRADTRRLSMGAGLCRPDGYILAVTAIVLTGLPTLSCATIHKHHSTLC